jgi:hypothetical protein
MPFNTITGTLSLHLGAELLEGDILLFGSAVQQLWQHLGEWRGLAGGVE